MEKLEYTEAIQAIVNKDCQRIMQEIIELYNKNVEVNKSFNELVKERITPKYLYLIDIYYSSIIKLIPTNLYICPNNRWALVDENEFNNIMLEESINNNDNNNIKEMINKVVEELINNKNTDFFETINKYLAVENKEHYNSKNILEDIYYELKKRGYTIISIEPLIINKD